jgi:hypothetical protein
MEHPKLLICSHCHSRIDIADIIRPDALLSATIPIRGYDILSAHRLRTVYIQSSFMVVAILGLLHKMTGATAIISSLVEGLGNGNYLRINMQLKALGDLGVWMSDINNLGSLKSRGVTLQGKLADQDRLKLPAGSSAVLEIEVLGAWWELGVEGIGE